MDLHKRSISRGRFSPDSFSAGGSVFGLLLFQRISPLSGGGPRVGSFTGIGSEIPSVVLSAVVLVWGFFWLSVRLVFWRFCSPGIFRLAHGRSLGRRSILSQSFGSLRGYSFVTQRRISPRWSSASLPFVSAIADRYHSTRQSTCYYVVTLLEQV